MYFNIVELPNGKIAKVHWDSRNANFHVYETKDSVMPTIFVYHDRSFRYYKVFKLTKRGEISKKKVSKKQTEYYINILETFIAVNCVDS